MAYVYVEDPVQDIEKGKPTVRLSGTDGNAFAIMGEVQKAMKEFQREDPTYNSKAMFAEFQHVAMSGDYDFLLQACFEFCEVN